MSMLIKGGRVINPADNSDAIRDIYIKDSRIHTIGSALSEQEFIAETTINAKDCIVFPGAVDLCARLREPGQTHKATIASEARAAAANGITTLCIPPDTEPVIDNPSVIKLIQKSAAINKSANIVTLAALTTQLACQQLSAMAALKDAGCVGVTNALQPISNLKVLRHAMEYAAGHDLTLHVVPLEPHLSAQGIMHEGATATRLGLKGIPVAAETVAIAQHLTLVEEIGIKTHFGRVTSQRALEMIDDAKQRGLPVTADVAIHHLHLTDAAIDPFNTQAYVIPPLRSEKDRQALVQGLIDGTIDAICSDHQPHERDAKLNTLHDAEPGISGLDTLVGLSLKLTENTELSLATIINKLTIAPANILNINAGNLTTEQIANLTILEPRNIGINSDNFKSAGYNTPFENWQLSYKIKNTIINGQLLS